MLRTLLGLTDWLNPFEWTVDDWSILGVLLTFAASAVGVVRWWLARRGAPLLRPEIVFRPLEFFGPDTPVREAYAYAIGVAIQNVGDVPAVHLAVGLIPPEAALESAQEREDTGFTPLYAEILTRPALLPGEEVADFLGLRGEDQWQDPDDASARRFYDECIAFVECWDRAGQHHVFFPFGGGPADAPWEGPHHLRQHLSGFPSRGEPRRSLGMGRREQSDDASH